MREEATLNFNDRHYHFRLSAEMNVFYLQDEAREDEVFWTDQEACDHLALSFGAIAVETRGDGIVPVEVQILSSEPQRKLEPWDQLIECSLDVHLVD